jgi:hypothetical protein
MALTLATSTGGTGGTGGTGSMVLQAHQLDGNGTVPTGVPDQGQSRWQGATRSTTSMLPQRSHQIGNDSGQAQRSHQIGNDSGQAHALVPCTHFPAVMCAKGKPLCAHFQQGAQRSKHPATNQRASRELADEPRTKARRMPGGFGLGRQRRKTRKN